MKKTIKRILTVILLIIVVAVAKHLYHIKLNYNFGEVTKNKVYKSGVIPPEKIEAYVTKHNIKTVIDFRHGQIGDKLNPENLDEIDKERQVVNAIKGVNYVNIPSGQIPTEQNLDSLYNVLDKEDAYPVLMHCYHGTGRAMIYSAIYKMEYEDMPNEEARKMTRPFYSLPFSSFAEDKPKGKYVKEYKKRAN